MKEQSQRPVNENLIEGRNAVMEAFRAGRPIDKLFVINGCQDGAVRSIVREAKKHDTIIQFVEKERLSQLSETGSSSAGMRYSLSPSAMASLQRSFNSIT